jgi:PUA domain protein
MAPGIRRYEGDFEEGDIVLVLDEKHGKAIAVGQSLLSSENAKNAKQGSTVKNIHFVSDNIWNFIKQFTH